MYPYIEISGHSISMYGICIAAGLLASIIYVLFAEKKLPALKNDINVAAAFSMIGIFVGAKLLYLLTVLPDFVNDIKSLSFSELFYLYGQNGFTFYGGVVGAVVTVFVYSRIAKTSFSEMCRVLVPVIPLFHFFGRVDCFMAGCCYGIENESYGIVFENSLVAPNDVAVIPTQLLEAAAELILFLILAVMANEGKKGINLLLCWSIAYSFFRFFVEFLRGDVSHGYLVGLTLSQILSCAVFIISAAGVIYRIIAGRKGRRQTQTEE